jgi:hypothetical protein
MTMEQKLIAKEVIRKKYQMMDPVLHERSKRTWAASEAHALGYGGVTIVAQATGISRETVHVGLLEIRSTSAIAPQGRIRRNGGGRKKLTDKDPTLKSDLEKLLEPTERGDPERLLRWTTKSSEHLAHALQGKHTISPDSIERILKAEKYSLQSNRKRSEGTNHPDRNEQFEYINDSVQRQQKRNQPCISVDTKKKENVGNFKNNGQEWHKSKQPIEVNMHDFPDKELGKASPYGVYDIIKNEGWVNVGISSDTAQFAVESIRRWWQYMGKERYPHATELLITADSGGSNSARSRLWKVALQKLATELNLTIKVRHFPPGTSKWNKIEHRLFSFITKNWRGKPLDSLTTIINLIGSTYTKTGLIVKAMLDESVYEKGLKVSDEEFETLNIKPDDFHGEWNYSIYP